MKHHFQDLALIGLLSLCSLPMAAQSSGYDLFQTGSGTSVDLSSLGLGVVKLQGVAIQGSSGNTDTIIHRTQDVPSGGGTVSVNVYALFMKSTSPVTFQGQSADVYVTINNTGGGVSTSTLPQPDSLSASTGSVTVRTDGTFDSNITVNADLIFVKAGTSVGDSANWIGHQAASSTTLRQPTHRGRAARLLAIRRQGACHPAASTPPTLADTAPRRMYMRWFRRGAALAGSFLIAP